MVAGFILIVTVFYLLITGYFVKKIWAAIVCSAIFAAWWFYYAGAINHFLPELKGEAYNRAVFLGANFIAIFIYYQILKMMENSFILWLATWLGGALVMLLMPGLALFLAAAAQP